MIRPLFILVILSAQAFAGDLLISVSPSKLISLLAPAPEGWTMVKSRAGNVFSGNLISVADRQFEFVPPPGPDGKQPERSVLTVQLTDTGMATERLAVFDPANAGPALTNRGGLPALDVPSPSGAKTLILIENRLLLSVQGVNVKPDLVEDYVTQTVGLIRKAQLPREPVPEISQTFSYIEEVVDEMNPKLNRKFKASAAIAVDIDATAPQPAVNFQ